MRPRLKTKSTAGTLKYQSAHFLAFRRKELKKGEERAVFVDTLEEELGRRKNLAGR